MAHTKKEELLKRLAETKERVEIGGKYFHYRNPDHPYIVTGLAINEATERISVIYYNLSEDPPISWIRALEGEDGFLTPVEVEGKTVPRFTKV